MTLEGQMRMLCLHQQSEILYLTEQLLAINQTYQR